MQSSGVFKEWKLTLRDLKVGKQLRVTVATVGRDSIMLYVQRGFL